MNEPIKDKAPKPPGLLPKNVQSWVIIGIALLMVVIMWLTGGKKPQATGKPAARTQKGVQGGTCPPGECTGRNTPGGYTGARRIPMGTTLQRDAASSSNTAALTPSIRGTEFRTITHNIGPGNRANPRTKGG